MSCKFNNTSVIQSFITMNYTTKQRNHDLMNAVHKAVATWNGDTPSVNEIIRKVLNSPAPTFYVSYETAYRYVSLAMRHKLPHNINSNRRRMWIDLAARVSAIMHDNPSYTYAKALLSVLEGEHAPSFYITTLTATRIYYNMLQKSKPHARLRHTTSHSH